MNDINRFLFVERSVEPFGFISRFSDHLNYFENYECMQSLQVFYFLKKILLRLLEKSTYLKFSKLKKNTVSVNLNAYAVQSMPLCCQL